MSTLEEWRRDLFLDVAHDRARPVPQLQGPYAAPSIGGKHLPQQRKDAGDRPPRARVVAHEDGTASVFSAGEWVPVSERNVQIICFLDRYRFATYTQLAERFGVSEQALTKQLPKLTRLGLLTSGSVPGLNCQVMLVTKLGQKITQLGLLVPHVSPLTAAHTLGAVDLGTSFELRGEAVLTEREIWATDRASRTRTRTNRKVRWNGPSTSVYRLRCRSANIEFHCHVPDLIIVRGNASANIAVELELSRKNMALYEHKLAAYQAATNFSSVEYYVLDDQVRKAIERCGRQLGMGKNRFSVHKFPLT